MRIAHLQTVCALVATRSQYFVEGPQVNKFEQVSSDGHQMSLAGGAGFPCLMSRGGGRAEGSIQ